MIFWIGQGRRDLTHGKGVATRPRCFKRPSSAIRRALMVAGCSLLVMLGAAAAAEVPDPTRFGVALEAGNAVAARQWLEDGLPPDYLADRIGTGLMIAAWNGDIPMMELFVAHGANVNAINRAGEQAIMHAAWKGRLEAVKWLADHGADINRQGKEWSALHYAVFAGHQEVAAYLIRRGANVDALSTNGSSPLMIAARQGHEGLAQMLLQRGADPRIVNDRGDNALAWAMRNRNFSIAKLVSSAAEFAEASRKPAESFGPPVKSVEAPAEIEDLLRQMRQAEAEGRPTEDIRKAFWSAVAEINKAAPPVVAAPPPSALVIRAKRGVAARGQESAELKFDRAPDKPMPGDRRGRKEAAPRERTP